MRQVRPRHTGRAAFVEWERGNREGNAHKRKTRPHVNHKHHGDQRCELCDGGGILTPAPGQSVELYTTTGKLAGHHIPVIDCPACYGVGMLFT